jgi:hypothetical protein
MKTHYKHIWFRDDSKDHPKRKTKTFSCFNYGNCFLGEVLWYPRWRQYCFAMYGGTVAFESSVFARSCLNDISDFIQQLMDERKSPRRPTVEGEK